VYNTSNIVQISSTHIIISSTRALLQVRPHTFFQILTSISKRMPPSSHSLFKQQRRQRLRLILVLFLSIPLIVEIKSHYYSAVDDDVYVENSAARPFVPRRGNEMEQHLQQLGQRVIIDGNDKDENDATRGDANARTKLPKFLAGEEEAMKYIDSHGKKGGGGGRRGGGGGGRTPSAQRRGWIASSSSSNSGSGSNNNKPDKKFYDVYLKNAIENKPAYPLLKGFLRTVLESYPASRTWFDGGAGTCGTMRALRSAGKIVRGIEISDVSKTSCKELAKEGVVETGVLNDLSRFEDKRFDVVFSSEVLEHVPTHLAEQSVKELVRIAKKDVFVTISLRRSGLDPKDPKKPAIVHLTVWPRERWERAFEKQGCVVNREVLRKFDRYDETRYGAKPNFFAFTCHAGEEEEEEREEEHEEGRVVEGDHHEEED